MDRITPNALKSLNFLRKNNNWFLENYCDCGIKISIVIHFNPNTKKLKLSVFNPICCAIITYDVDDKRYLLSTYLNTIKQLDQFINFLKFNEEQYKKLKWISTEITENTLETRLGFNKTWENFGAYTFEKYVGKNKLKLIFYSQNNIIRIEAANSYLILVTDILTTIEQLEYIFNILNI
jgi:hypothetical protein